MVSVDIERVAALIRQVAAEEALPRWRNLGVGDIVEKAGPDDLVTVADRAVEVALARQLIDVLPGSCVVGEEAVHADPGKLALFQASAPVWVIDPIDGTSAFAKGSPDFAVMVGLVEKGELAAGWIYAPVTGDFVCGGRSDGVWRSSESGFRRLPTPGSPGMLALMRGITGRRMMSVDRQRRIDAASKQFAAIDTATCAGLEYPRLLGGDAHFALYNKSEPWDHLPGLALAAELGFHFAKHDGSPYRPGDNTGGLLVAPDRDSWNEIHAVLIADR